MTNFRAEDAPKTNIARDELLRLADAHGIGAEVRELLANRIPPPPMTFRQLVNGARRIRGWSQDRLAREAGIGLTQLWSGLNGKQVPRLHAIISLSRALGVHWHILILGVLWEQDWLASAPGANLPRMRYRHIPHEEGSAPPD